MREYLQEDDARDIAGVLLRARAVHCTTRGWVVRFENPITSEVMDLGRNFLNVRRGLDEIATYEW